MQADFTVPSMESVTTASGSVSPGQTAQNLALRSDATLPPTQAGSVEVLPSAGGGLGDMPQWNQEAWRDTPAASPKPAVPDTSMPPAMERSLPLSNDRMQSAG